MRDNRQPTIGLEIHVELKTNSKMFCFCANDPLERHPNINVCPICLGHPGTLPVINEEAVRKVIKTGLALGCQIPEYSKFDRKSYFYPDLPKGYQISQYDKPLCEAGYLETEFLSVLRNSVSKSAKTKIRIRRVHLEEDTGRLIHEQDRSLVDFNRAGVPLMELVTEPDLKSARETKAFAQELQLILRYLGVSDADMENGQMRVEVNISLNGGPKVEIKNLNSFRAVERSIEYETERQARENVIQETRGWDDVKGVTKSQRLKEEAQDYRYFPEPDLPPLRILPDLIEKIKSEIPELPRQKRERLIKQYDLDESSAEIFVQNKDLGEYFEKVMSELGQPKLAKLCVNYIITDLQGLLKGASVIGEDFRITPENFAEFIELIGDGKLSSKLAKEVLAGMFSTGAEPDHIIEDRGLIQISDESEIKKIAEEVISQNPKAVEDFKKGRENSLQFLLGQVMAKTKGKASPEISRKALLAKLKY